MNSRASQTGCPLVLRAWLDEVMTHNEGPGSIEGIARRHAQLGEPEETLRWLRPGAIIRIGIT